MTEQKKQPRKNPSPLVVQGTFYVTATFEDKQYVVSNGLSFLRFAEDGDDIKKGDYVSIHGPVYQKKDASHPIVTGEAIVKKLTEKEVEECYIFRAYFGDDDFWSFEDREIAESPDVHKFSIVVFADGSALYRDGWSGDVWTCNRDDFIGQDIFWYDSIFYNVKTGEEVKMDF